MEVFTGGIVGGVGSYWKGDTQMFGGRKAKLTK